MLESLIGAVVWLIANAVYFDKRRTGTGGFGRICAFCMGLPTTWLWMLTVREGSQPKIAPPPDDDAALLAEVRRDRALRGGDPDGLLE